MKKVACYFDGCTEPRNPGGAMGTGSIVKVDGVTLYAHSEFYPEKSTNTNNVSEYIAFGLCLKYLIDNNLTGEEVAIMGDSQLVVNQMGGSWAMNEGLYVKYAIRCKELLAQFKKKPTIFWIKRDQNSEADELSKQHLAKNNISITTHPNDKTIIKFGKYAGKSVNDVDDLGYLKWALSSVKMKLAFRSLLQSRIAHLEYLAK